MDRRSQETYNTYAQSIYYMDRIIISGKYNICVKIYY